MNTVSVLVYPRSAFLLTTVFDLFGKSWKVFRSPCRIGSIHECVIHHDPGTVEGAGFYNTERLRLNGSESKVAFRILAEAKIDEIAEAVSRLPKRDWKLSPGHWYEVHGD